MSLQLLAFSLSLFLALSNGQKLQVFEAAVPGAMSGWEAGPVLSPEETLCVDDLPSPFTIVCIPDEDQSPSYAKFFVNGNFFRTERALPYVLTGDTFRAGAAAWIPDSGLSEVMCRLSTGDFVTSRITFSCGGTGTTTLPPTTTTMTTTLPPTTTTATTLPPTTTAATTLPPSTTTATTLPPITTTATTLPPTTATATTLPPTTNVPPPADYCIYIPAKSYESKTGDWEEGMVESMEYKFDDDSTKTDRPGLATLRYSFTPLYTARYALTIDMFTSDGLDHNDVWVEIVGVPFTLVSKTGISMPGKSGFNKAYHNRNGRGSIVFTADFDPHVFSTAAQLQAGETYTVKVGGRSTKVALFGVIVFPCESYGCELVREWYRSANTCSAQVEE